MNQLVNGGTIIILSRLFCLLKAIDIRKKKISRRTFDRFQHFLIDFINHRVVKNEISNQMNKWKSKIIETEQLD